MALLRTQTFTEGSCDCSKCLRKVLLCSQALRMIKQEEYLNGFMFDLD